MSFYQQLDDGLITCPLWNQEFLPLSEVEEKITRDNIRAQLPWSTLLINRGLSDKIFQCAKKVFAILVLMGEPGTVRDVVEDGLTDEHLPLSRKGGTDGNVLESMQPEPRTFKSFATWPSKKVKEFLEKQWHLQAPVLDMTGKHIVLDRKCALPFLAVHEIYTTILIRVYKGTLHPAHQGDGTETNIAIKEFSNESSFSIEKENLLQIQQLQHSHLIKLIATCQRGSTYYVMFPWAEGGSITDLWKREDVQRDRTRILWSLRQMLGLVDALKALHSKNCRHGDLKPDNILHFENKDETLVIADVGISKFHKEVTSLRKMKTNTTATTRSYEAPEAQPDHEDPRSRVYDMWSIGCIFLEFAVWLLYGYRGVRSFKKSRKSVDPMIQNGSFYARHPNGSVELHSKVSEAIQALLEDPPCKGSAALADFVRLTARDLLLVDVSGRAQASVVYEKLEKIVKDAEEQNEYLHIELDPSPRPHPFFRTDSRQNSTSAPVSSPGASQSP
ncbi:Calcium calmodulin-dependent kinase I [Hyphodiscus hymeniophilus]|uniref:Calcium calmodulin-dependent kinase I n=1 Tax=Hyphodiscus hymeniophilus TaxID=353542 RepID=A0A9P6VF29_9HELO|nr:Calcium calmodulin-dependent kinase I [Hyphodiscus hymeniophilus]